jgi:hypothetical protein
MNQRLAEFLMSLVRDPEKLEAFNSDDDEGRRNMLADADLSAEEKDALLAADSTAILELLQATDEDGLTWLGVPGIKGEPPRIKFTVGFAIFGIKGGTTAASTTSTRSTTRRTAKKGAKKGGRGAKSSAKSAKSSKSARTAKAAKARGTKRRR